MDSIRWENYLEAQEDFEYLWLLNEVLESLEHTTDYGKKEIDDLKDQFKGLVSEVVGEKWNYCDEVTTLYDARIKIGNLLDSFSSEINITSIGEAPWTPPYHLEV